MKVGIEYKIDVNKINKAKLYQGKKGNYLTLISYVDLDNKDQYENNGFITEASTDQERADKTQLTILGNSKVFWSDGNQQSSAPVVDSFDDEKLPF